MEAQLLFYMIILGFELTKSDSGAVLLFSDSDNQSHEIHEI